MRQRERVFIKEWRKLRGYSQEQLADHLGVKKPTISRIESGKRPYNQDQLEAAAEFLKVDVAALLKCDPNDPSNAWAIWEAIQELTPQDIERALRTVRAIPDKKAS